MDLVDYGRNYFLIMCRNNDELQLLTGRANLKIVTRCRCGCGGFQDGLEMLACIVACRSFAEFQLCGGSRVLDLYLVQELDRQATTGVAGNGAGCRQTSPTIARPAGVAQIAAVVKPSWRRSVQGSAVWPAFRVGLRSAGPLPPPAQTLIKLVEEQWPTPRPTVLF